MRHSFETHGFSNDCAEYITIDNSKGNGCDGFQGVNYFITNAQGDYIIISHQDVVLVDEEKHFSHIIHQLDVIDNQWAAFGNAGSRLDNSRAVRISDPNFRNVSIGGPFPTRVRSLDENFIVIRRDANLAVSNDMQGFHFYGTDLCIIADLLGYNTYVVDFHVLHKSAGTMDRNYHAAREAMTRKYNRAFRTRWVYTPTRRAIPLSGSFIYIFFFRVIRKIKYKILRRE